jgi:hypothetical protein
VAHTILHSTPLRHRQHLASGFNAINSFIRLNTITRPDRTAVAADAISPPPPPLSSAHHAEELPARSR